MKVTIKHCKGRLEYFEESWWLAVTQSPVKDYQLKLAWKICVKWNDKLPEIKNKTKLGKIKMTVMVIIVKALRTILKNLEKRLEELEIRRRNETIHTNSKIGKNT